MCRRLVKLLSALVWLDDLEFLVIGVRSVLCSFDNI